MNISIKMNPGPLEKSLHERALVVAQNYRRIESQLIEILQKLDEKKVFRALGYSSLFQYAVEELKLSDQTAYNFITVSRKAREIPEIKKEIKAGNLTVAKARRITPVINKDNALSWLEKAKELPQKKLEKEVAKVSPRTLTPEKSKYVTEKRLQVQVGLEEEVFEQLKRVQDLLSQNTGKPASLEDAIVELTGFYLEKKDPVRKAARVMKKKENNPPKLGARRVGKSDVRKPIPSGVRHAVHQRDQMRCAYQDMNGKRCEETRWLDFHHRIPVSKGGPNEASNLITLCKTHHQLMHQDQVWYQSPRQLLNQIILAG